MDSDVSLNDYVREVLNLRGTKYMCKEGGCGACVVSICAKDPSGHPRTFSVNSVSSIYYRFMSIQVTSAVGLIFYERGTKTSMCTWW